MLALLTPLVPRQLSAVRHGGKLLSPWRPLNPSNPNSPDRPVLLALCESLLRPSPLQSGQNRGLCSEEGGRGRGKGEGEGVGEAEVVIVEGREGSLEGPGAAEGEEVALAVEGSSEIEGRGRKRRRKVAAVAAADEGKESLKEKGGESGEAVETSIVVAGPRPENYPKVLAIPLTRRPLIPGFFVPVQLKNPKMVEALMELKNRGTPYVGTFLTKKAVREGAGFISEGEEGSAVELYGKEFSQRMHEYGTFAQILHVTPGPESTQVLFMGHRRLRWTSVVEEDPLTVTVEHLKDKPYDPEANDVMKATVMEVVSTLKDLIALNPLYKEHIPLFTQHVGDFNPSRIADFGAALTTADDSMLQGVLSELEVEKRLGLTLMLLKKELDLAKLQASIAKGVEEKISGEQRRYVLLEQLKAIKKELGLEKDDKTTLIGKFRTKLEPFREACPPQVLQVIEEEIAKLQGLEGSSSEFNVTRNYLDWLTSLPWGHHSKENFDVRRAQNVLDADHYGLEDVKERILEFIAVGKLRGTAQGKIICLVGPPGVGKTSIGRSIANALNRKFYRFSVGGLSDVAEIKGHRRTYVGAMPGKVVQCLKAVQTANPLVLIDEIDKLGRGNSGDPASALLELLDPEQNSSFLDHYLDVPIDLSKVLFVCTANVLETIPVPLLDRMEIIRLAGYIGDEKMHIARGYLEPNARNASGVALHQVEITEDAILRLVEDYCREAGVRSLQKHIERIYRKIALQVVRREAEMEKTHKEDAVEGVQEAVVGEAEGKESHGSHVVEIAEKIIEGGKFEEGELVAELTEESEDEEVRLLRETERKRKEVEEAVAENGKLQEEQLTNVQPPAQQTEGEVASRVIGEKIVVSGENLQEYAGQPVFQNERLYEQTPLGVVMGLAWTSMGGSTLYVETSIVEQGEGKGGLKLTGQLGDVMKESATIAHTVARRIFSAMAPGNSFFSSTLMHLHVPAGATPKDGPSAGCTMITSMLSLALGRPVRKDLAMTGEVTLTGRVLPIGGVKEKTIGARRSGVKTIIFPKANRRDFEELLPHVREGLDAHFTDSYEEIFRLAFEEEGAAQSAVEEEVASTSA